MCKLRLRFFAVGYGVSKTGKVDNEMVQIR